MCAKKLSLKDLVRFRSKCAHEIAEIDYELRVSRELQKRAMREGRTGIAHRHRNDAVALENERVKIRRRIEMITRKIRRMTKNPRLARLKQPRGYLRKRHRAW